MTNTATQTDAPWHAGDPTVYELACWGVHVFAHRGAWYWCKRAQPWALGQDIAHGPFSSAKAAGREAGHAITGNPKARAA